MSTEFAPRPRNEILVPPSADDKASRSLNAPALFIGSCCSTSATEIAPVRSISGRLSTRTGNNLSGSIPRIWLPTTSIVSMASGEFPCTCACVTSTGVTLPKVRAKMRMPMPPRLDVRDKLPWLLRTGKRDRPRRAQPIKPSKKERPGDIEPPPPLPSLPEGGSESEPEGGSESEGSSGQPRYPEPDGSGMLQSKGAESLKSMTLSLSSSISQMSPPASELG